MNIFITGTDTDVGKTIVTAGLAVAAKSIGRSVGVFKPLQTGCSIKNNELVSTDIEFVKSVELANSAWGTDSQPEIQIQSSYNFIEPVAPSLAAELEGVDINLDKIVGDYNNLKEKCDLVITEGAGGLLVPIKNDFLMRDLAKLLDLPLVIVARPDLGTINHTLLTIEAAKSKNLHILGIIICNYPSDTEDIAIKTAPEIIRKLSGEKILGVLPKIENLENNKLLLKEVVLNNLDLSFL